MAARRGLTPDAYRALAVAGYSASEAARLLGVTPQTAHAVAAKNGFRFVAGYIRKEKRDACALDRSDVPAKAG